MLRIHFLQHWLKLVNEMGEEPLVDSAPLRRFVGTVLDHERVPSGTTILKFHRLMENNTFTQSLFVNDGDELNKHDLTVGTGIVVHATIIGTPMSTKNADTACDPHKH